MCLNEFRGVFLEHHLLKLLTLTYLKGRCVFGDQTFQFVPIRSKKKKSIHITAISQVLNQEYHLR